MKWMCVGVQLKANDGIYVVGSLIPVMLQPFYLYSFSHLILLSIK